ncbi:MAG TPA: transglutaminase family protein [Beijerinckiaceae bacterium]|nr:transglutaminase family protein [Beijerinckiaceae bacterium]
MRIQCGYEIAYDCAQPTPMLLMLRVHPSRQADLEAPERIALDPPVRATEYRDGFGNLCTRITAPPGRITISNDFIVRDGGEPDLVVPEAEQHALEDLPDHVLVFLLGSRYCDTDRLSEEAWSLFGGTAPGWPRVQAICDYVHDRLEFGYEHASSFRTAWDGHNEGRGVCRDFAHLAIAFCRCMNIPARYCTGYLGEIGMPPPYGPMDFAAWFEVFLDGRWHTFDSRNNTPRIGRVLIARGRDASDVALSSTFGVNKLVEFKVWTDEVAVT